MTSVSDVVQAPARRLRVLRRPQATTGFWSWFTTIDHKKIGIMYGTTALAFLVIGGIEALLLRLQLAGPNGSLLTAAQYNELFTMHGTGMIFFFATPLVVGLANYFTPLHLGAADVVFPRLNAFGFWLSLAGALTAFAGFLTAGGAAAFGWTAYPPLSSSAFSPGSGADLWIIGVALTGTGSILAAVNLIATIFGMRAPTASRK